MYGVQYDLLIAQSTFVRFGSGGWELGIPYIRLMKMLIGFNMGKYLVGSIANCGVQAFNFLS